MTAMSSISTYVDGKLVSLPFGFKFARKIRGRLVNDITLKIDERDFDSLYGRHAVWVHGKGPYALLAYCGELTIQRYATVDDAVQAKRAIDGGGCGGSCAKVHLIIYCDPANTEHEEEQVRIREYLAKEQST